MIAIWNLICFSHNDIKCFYKSILINLYIIIDYPGWDEWIIDMDVAVTTSDIVKGDMNSIIQQTMQTRADKLERMYPSDFRTH